MMGNWHYIVIVACLVLLAYTFWREIARTNKRFIVLRLLASLLAVASLACMALPVSIGSNKLSNDEVIVLTDGYNNDSVQAFTKAANKTMHAFTADELMASGKTNYKALHVFGYGLSVAQLQALHNQHLIFHPAAIGTGITSASWQQTLQTGRELQVQGRFNNTGVTPVKLVLNGFNTALDSVSIQPNTQQPFQLSTIPKQSGKAVYNITASVGNNIIANEPVPVEVTQADSLKVLMLAASPDFENRFLKDWLSHNACQVVVRTATSKDKYDMAFLNTPAITLSHITPALLQQFDVVLCDAVAFAALAPDEQNSIRTKVRDGLGLVIKTDTTLPASSFYTQYFPVYAAQTKQLTSTLQLAGGGALHSVPNEQPLYIRSQQGTQAIATDSAAQIVAGTTLYGAGRIVVTTFSNSFNWMLTGNKDSYYNFWSALLSKALKNKEAAESIAYSPAVPRINQLLQTTFVNTGSSVPQPLIGESHVYLKQQALLPFIWNGNYWPSQPGWVIAGTGTNTTNLYVYNSSDWKYITAAENMAATALYVSQQSNSTANVEPSTSTEKTALPKIYFFIVLMVCCTFLWVEKKFNG